jgi:transposase, IS30 family
LCGVRGSFSPVLILRIGPWSHACFERSGALNRSAFGLRLNAALKLALSGFINTFFRIKQRVTLYHHLRCQKQRRKRYGSYSRRGQLINRVSIDERTAIVDTCSRLGDWELDNIIGKVHKQSIVSLTERKSRLTLIKKVSWKTADNVADAIINLLKPIACRVHTMTSDNGKEFARHETIAKALKAKFYFAHPYDSWQRGLNENTNGLIRQYFPKDCDFTMITEKQINHVMDRLNNRPRKCLGIKTPNQVFFGIDPHVALAT